jgi:sugar phosphate isomerase/epimerase
MSSSPSTSRRRFFKTAGLGLGTAGVAASTSSFAAAPLPRNGQSHMKLSVAAYSFNKLLAKRGTPEEIAKAGMRLEEVVDFSAKNNLDGVELTSYYFPKDVTHEYLMGLKQQCFRLGLDVSGTAIGNDFCHGPGAARDEQLAMTREWIDHAAVVGAPVIRIFAGNVKSGTDEAQALKNCIAGINESLEYAATKGVFLALENHGGITATPKQMMRIIDGVEDSPWFGVNLDGGNFNTDDPYRDLAVIAPYAINAQIKVKVKNNGVKEEADFARVIGILKDANYRGYIVLEYEEADPLGEIPRYLDTLRELLVR